MIRFSRYWFIYICISLIVLVPGIYTLIRFGLRPSVDFIGGTLLGLSIEKTTTGEAVQQIGKEQGVTILSVQKSQENQYVIRMPVVSQEEVVKITKAIEEKTLGKVIIERYETVGPILGKELLAKSITAAIFAIIAILLYVAYAFKDIKFGVSAIIALVHDVLVVFGSFALFGYLWGVEVDTLFMTAFLTTMSFSVHDTIVIFDRIREYRKREGRASLQDVCDVALTETMGRSLINSFTIIFMLLALVLMGGESIKWFAVALLIGTVTGTYSSPFVATPLLILWDKIEKNQKRKKYA